MKRSTITLSIISAILLSACGSSSNSDNNQPVDPTPTPNPAPAPKPAPTPTAPTTPTSAASNPAPEVVNPSSPSSSNSNNNPISPPSIPSISGKPHQYPSITLKKDEEAKKKSEEEEAKKKAEEEAKKKAEEVAKKKAEEEAKKEPIKAPVLDGLATKTEAELKELINNAVVTKEKASREMVANQRNISSYENSLQSKLTVFTSNIELNDKAREFKKNKKDSQQEALYKKFAEFEEEKRGVLEELNNYAKAKIDLVEPRYLSLIAGFKKDIYENVLETQEAAKEDPAAVVEVKKTNEEYLKLMIEQNVASGNLEILTGKSEVIDKKIETLEAINALNTTVITNEDVPTDIKEKLAAENKSNDETITQLKKEKMENEKVKLDAQKKVNNINLDLKTAENKFKEAEEAAKYRGVYGNGKYEKEAAPFQDISKVEHSNDKQWILTLKNGDKLTIDTNNITNTIGDSNKVWGTFGKVGNKNVKIGTLEDQGSTLFGSIDDKFFSVGDVATKLSVKNLNSAEFNGKAILKTSDDKVDLVSKVMATFSGKELSGNFSDFRTFVEVDKNKPVSYDKLEEVTFTALVKGNKFTPKGDQDDTNAKVYGYFYGSTANEIGGLVDHKDFHGAFGAKR